MQVQLMHRMTENTPEVPEIWKQSSAHHSVAPFLPTSGPSSYLQTSQESTLDEAHCNLLPQTANSRQVDLLHGESQQHNHAESCQ